MTVSKRNQTVSVIYFIVVMLTLVLRILYSLGLPQYVPVPADYLFALIVQVFIFGIVPFVCYLLLHYTFSDGMLPPLKSMAFRFGLAKRVSGKNWARTVAITFLMIFTAAFLSWMWQSALSAFGFVQTSTPTDYKNIGVLFLELLTVALLPALFEEFTHRGLLFAGFRTNNLKDGYKLILFSALLFSLMHQNIRQTGYTFYDGIIMGLLCYYTGSLYPAIFAHFTNNAFSVLSAFFEQKGAFDFVSRAYEWLLSSFAGFAVFLISFIAGTVLLAFLLWRMRKDFIREQADIRVTRALADGTLKLNGEGGAQNSDKWAEAQYLLESGVSGADVLSSVNGGDLLARQVAQNGAAQNQNGETIDQSEVKKNPMYPITRLTLPDDFSRGFDERNLLRKQIFLYVTIAAGVVCAVLSLVWGLLR